MQILPPKANFATELVRVLLAEADVVLAKGDANYRRALGDAHWPWTPPLADVVSYFPTPIVFLRTWGIHLRRDTIRSQPLSAMI